MRLPACGSVCELTKLIFILFYCRPLIRWQSGLWRLAGHSTFTFIFYPAFISLWSLLLFLKYLPAYNSVKLLHLSKLNKCTVISVHNVEYLCKLANLIFKLIYVSLNYGYYFFNNLGDLKLFKSDSKCIKVLCVNILKCFSFH